MKFILTSLLLLSTISVFADTHPVDTSELAKKLVEEKCSKCHQEDGNSKNSEIPKIAGFSASLIFDSLDQFKSEYRTAEEIKTKNGEVTDMVKISKQLTENEIEALATYFATQTFKAEPQEYKKELTETGKQLHLDLCNDCHVDLGTSSADDAPILAGQWKGYLTKQFDAFYNFKRKMPRRMKKKFRQLNEEDIKALIEFYASSTSQTTINTDK